MGLTKAVKKAMYRAMPLERYLKTVSRAYFLIYRSGLSPLFRVYEYPRFLKRLVRRGDTVIDIGANLGYYSWFFSRLAGPDGKVYAVEPVKPICSVLRHNLRKCPNVEIYNYALGGEEKEVTMGNDSVRGEEHFATGQNFVLGADETGRAHAQNEFAAHMCRGSELFAGLERLDMIKCDIEGYEGVVIREMEPVIDKHKPLVLLESGGESRKMLTEFFEAKGYAAFVLVRGRLRNAAGYDDRDIVFVPPSRMDGLKPLIEK